MRQATRFAGWLARLRPWQALVLAVAVTLVVFLPLLFVVSAIVAIVVAVLVGFSIWLLWLLAWLAGPPRDDDGSAPDAVGGGITFGDLTEHGFGSAPTRPGFQVVDEGQAQPAGNLPGGSLPPGTVDSPDGHDFRGAGGRLGTYLHLPWPDEPSYPDDPGRLPRCRAAHVPEPGP